MNLNTRTLKKAYPILIVVGVLTYYEFFRKKQMKKVKQDETIEAPRMKKMYQPSKGGGMYSGSKAVSKLLGVNQGLASLGAVIGYMVLGVGVGLYTGTSLFSKARRVIIFGVGFPLSATIIGGVGDSVVSKFKTYKK